jgi:hypothetical protein
LRSALVEPSLKNHWYDVTFPVDASVNCTARGASPDDGFMLNPATGAVGLVTLIWRATFDVPPGPVIVSVTV